MQFARSWEIRLADVMGLDKTVMQSWMKFKLDAERHEETEKVFQ